MLETDTEKNSSYGSKPALPRAGEQKNVPARNFNMIFERHKAKRGKTTRGNIFLRRKSADDV